MKALLTYSGHPLLSRLRVSRSLPIILLNAPQENEKTEWRSRTRKASKERTARGTPLPFVTFPATLYLEIVQGTDASVILTEMVLRHDVRDSSEIGASRAQASGLVPD